MLTVDFIFDLEAGGRRRVPHRHCLARTFGDEILGGQRGPNAIPGYRQPPAGGLADAMAHPWRFDAYLQWRVGSGFAGELKKMCIEPLRWMQLHEGCICDDFAVEGQQAPQATKPVLS
jgi:hypothetical protein